MPLYARAAMSALITAAVTAGTLVAIAPSASAAGCSGTRISTMPLKAGTKTAGQAELWYSSSNGGTNCVIVYDQLSGSHDMAAYIDRGSAGGWDKTDVGTYTYYAGPVSLTNMSGTCVSWGGDMIVGNTYYSAFRYNVHCG